MGKFIAEFTMSLDGFIAEPNDDVGRLMKWYRSGDTPLQGAGTDMVFKVSQASAEFIQEQWSNIGAIVTGRRDFDVSKAWGGKRPLNVPTFVVTHSVPQEWSTPESPFTFITDGVESALAKAKQAAGDRNIAVSGSKVVQQGLKAGLLDELLIDLVPMLLGDGIRLFDDLGTRPIDLEIIRVIEATGVTHLMYRVVK